MSGSRPVRNSKYYLETVIFQVEDELFKVPKDLLEAGSMFQLEAEISMNGLKGLSDEKPIVLEGVAKQSFEALISIIYPSTWPGPRTDIPELERFLAALDLATMLDLHHARQHAIVCLTKLWDKYKDPCLRSVLDVDRVVYGNQFGVPEWLVDGYSGLVAFVGELTDDEVERLGTDVAYRLARVNVNVREENKTTKLKELKQLWRLGVLEEFAREIQDAEVCFRVYEA